MQGRSISRKLPTKIMRLKQSSSNKCYFCVYFVKFKNKISKILLLKKLISILNVYHTFEPFCIVTYVKKEYLLEF